MKSLQCLLLLTPLVCLHAQTPASQPATPPTVSVQPAAPVAAKVPPETVILTVGDEKITAGEFDHMIDMIPEQYRNQMRTTGRRQFAENIIRLKVMAQEAHRRKLEDTPAFKSQLAFQSEQLLAQQLYQNLQTTTKVDEAAARAYYEEHKSEYLQVKARHILIRAKGSAVPLKKDSKELTEEEALAKAKDIRKKLVDGADFATLAKSDSDDAGSGANGGDLGTFGHGRMVPAFEQVAFSIPVGEISEPVKSQFGYHIIKVESRQEKTFVEVRPEIERKLDAELVKKTMDDLKNSASVVMNEEYFGPPAPAMPAQGARPPITIQPQPQQKPAPK
ncbi:MAG TPA: peptidylprolyl isomerase [Bryobacteraceae bacterium]|nr:peptidylprolyl isomerase [Bryobacteraceae bacterium]